MPDSPSKRQWMANNSICVCVRINKNQDPELYAALSSTENKSGYIRALLKKALEQK